MPFICVSWDALGLELASLKSLGVESGSEAVGLKKMDFDAPEVKANTLSTVGLMMILILY